MNQFKKLKMAVLTALGMTTLTMSATAMSGQQAGLLSPDGKSPMVGALHKQSGQYLPQDVQLFKVAKNARLYRQYFHQIPVYGALVTELTETTGASPRLFSQLYPRQKLEHFFGERPIKARVSKQQALELALQHFAGAKLKAHLYIYPFEKGPALTWVVGHQLGTDQGEHGSQVLLNADTGDFIRRIPAVTTDFHDSMLKSAAAFGFEDSKQTGMNLTCPNESRFHDGRGSGHLNDIKCFPGLKVDIDLLQYTRAQGFKDESNELITYEYPSPVPSDPSSPFSAPDDDMIAASTPRPSGQPGVDDFKDEHKSAVDIQTHLWWLKEYWGDTANSPGSTNYYPKANQDVRAMVNIPGSVINFSGAYSPQYDMFMFADLPNVPSSTSALDVVAHEWVHAIFKGKHGATSDNYWANAMQESVADYFAVVAEAAITGQAIDWTLAEDILPSGQVLRNLADPHSANGGTGNNANPYYPDNYCEVQRYRRLDTCEKVNNPDPSIDYHEEGAPLSLAFKLLATGGKHPRHEKWPHDSVKGIGLKSAADILYKVLENSSLFADGQNPDYFAFRDASVAAAPSSQKDAVRGAFHAVGIIGHNTIDGYEGEINGSVSAAGTYHFKLNTEAFQLHPDTRSMLVYVSGPNTSNFTVRAKAGYYPDTNTYDKKVDAVNGRVSLEVPIEATDQDVFFSVTTSGPVGEMNFSGLPGEAKPVNEGEPKPNQKGDKGKTDFHKLDIPQQQGKTVSDKTLVVTISGGTGDADLYLKYQGFPTPNEYDLKAVGPGNNHQISIANPAFGEWVIGIDGQSDYDGVTLLAELNDQPCAVPPSFSGVGTVNDLTGNGVGIYWNAATSNCNGSIRYDVYRATHSGVLASSTYRIASNVSNNFYNDYNVQADTEYFYLVRATDVTANVGETNMVVKSVVNNPDTNTSTFTASDGMDPNNPIVEGTVISLNWTFPNAQNGVYIVGIGSFPGTTGSTNVSPDETTTYTAYVDNNDYNATVYVTPSTPITPQKFDACDRPNTDTVMINGVSHYCRAVVNTQDPQYNKSARWIAYTDNDWGTMVGPSSNPWSDYCFQSKDGTGAWSPSRYHPPGTAPMTWGNATWANGRTETADGLDNDCNGLIDDLPTPDPVSIAGDVEELGIGVSGVTITLSGDGSGGNATVSTSSNGSFNGSVSAGSSSSSTWTGDIIPSKNGYTFSPSARYNVTINGSSGVMDFTAIPDNPVCTLTSFSTSAGFGSTAPNVKWTTQYCDGYSVQVRVTTDPSSGSPAACQLTDTLFSGMHQGPQRANFMRDGWTDCPSGVTRAYFQVKIYDGQNNLHYSSSSKLAYIINF